MRDLIKYTQLIEKRREEKSPAPDGIRTNDLSVTRNSTAMLQPLLLRIKNDNHSDGINCRTDEAYVGGLGKIQLTKVIKQLKRNEEPT